MIKLSVWQKKFAIKVNPDTKVLYVPFLENWRFKGKIEVEFLTINVREQIDKVGILSFIRIMFCQLLFFIRLIFCHKIDFPPILFEFILSFRRFKIFNLWKNLCSILNLWRLKFGSKRLVFHPIAFRMTLKTAVGIAIEGLQHLLLYPDRYLVTRAGINQPGWNWLLNHVG